MERRWRPVIIFSAAATPGLVAYLAWNWMVYGHFTATGGYDVGSSGGGMLGLVDNLAGTLVSPERGLLVCSPILVLAAIGLRSAWRQSPMAVRVFALAGLAYLASQLWLIRYSGGDGFIGYRTCLESLIWCLPLLLQAGVCGSKKVGSALTWLLTVVSVAFFAGGAFDLGETSGIANPWTTWTPLRLSADYGFGRLLIGVAIGVAAVFAVWGITRQATVELNYRPVQAVDTSEGCSLEISVY
jgi:hypothetical protein